MEEKVNKPIWKVALLVLVVGFIMYCSSVLAFAFDESQYTEKEVQFIANDRIYTYQYKINQLSDNLIYVFIYSSGTSSYGGRGGLCIVNKSDGTILSQYDYSSYVKSRYKFDSVDNSYIGDFSDWTNGILGLTGTSSTKVELLISDIPTYEIFSKIQTGTTKIDLSKIQGGGLDLISGNNYGKNEQTMYSTDIYYPTINTFEYNHTTDKILSGFSLTPSDVRYNDTAKYLVELWMIHDDKRIFFKEYPLNELSYQSHTSSGSWGVSSSQTLYKLDFVLHDVCSWVDELENPITMEIRFVYKVNQSLFLESGYTDITFDLVSGKVDSVNYYPDGMDEQTNKPEKEETKKEIVTPTDVNRPIYNIDWDNSNLDDYIKGNFGLKNYILALKDVLGFLPDWIWDLQFYTMGAISSIGIIKFIRG